ncbi:MAG: nuclear transport factor 2 family protein [Bacteroidota bacterium]
MMRFPSTLLALLFIALAMTSCTNSPKYTEKSLTQTVAAHFTAIDARDLNALLKTVDENAVSMILPSGKYSTSQEDYQKVNKEWFAAPNWHINHQVIEQKISGNIGIVLTKITYNDKQADGTPYAFDYYLTLIFQHDDRDWRLIFDQNTLIE